MFNFRKVSHNLFRSSAPTPEDVIWLNKKVGITRIISLDEDAGKKINLSCKLLDIDHINLPIDGVKKSGLILFISNFDKLLENEAKTLIHCKFGKDRTSLAVGMYRCIKDGWTADEAIKEAKTFGFGKGLPDYITHTYEQLIKDCDKKDDVNEVSDLVDASRDNGEDDDFASHNLSWAPFYSSNPSIGYNQDMPTTLNDGEGNPLGQFGPSIVGNGTVI